MDINELKEDIRNVEYDLEYGEEQNQGRIAVNVNCLRSVIDFANEAVARQTTSEEVAEAIGQMNDALDPQHLESDGEWTRYSEFSTNTIRTAMAALQAHQPWVDVGTSFPKGSFLGELSNGEIVIIKEYFEGENPFNILESPGLVFVLTDGRSVPDKNWNCVYLKRWRELPKGEYHE